MRHILHHSILPVLAVVLLAIASCSSRQNTTQSIPTKSSARPKSLPKNPPSTSAKNATIKADPNPIQVCDGSGLGGTTLTYSSEGPAAVEMRVGSPNGLGGVLTHTGPNGAATTGKWVSDGLVFYLQDVSDGKSLTPDNTLASVTVHVTTAGCR